MQDGIVPVAHVLRPSQLRERGILPLSDVVQFVGVTVAVARRESLPNQVGIVVLGPLVIVGQLVAEPGVAPDAVVRPIDIRPDQRRPAADDGLLELGFSIDIFFWVRLNEARDFR